LPRYPLFSIGSTRCSYLFFPVRAFSLQDIEVSASVIRPICNCSANLAFSLSIFWPGFLDWDAPPLDPSPRPRFAAWGDSRFSSVPIPPRHLFPVKMLRSEPCHFSPHNLSLPFFAPYGSPGRRGFFRNTRFRSGFFPPQEPQFSNENLAQGL